MHDLRTLPGIVKTIVSVAEVLGEVNLQILNSLQSAISEAIIVLRVARNTSQIKIALTKDINPIS